MSFYSITSLQKYEIFLFIFQPLENFLVGKLFSVHQNACAVDFCRNPGHQDKCSSQQEDRDHDLPNGHTERNPDHHGEGGGERYHGEP